MESLRIRKVIIINPDDTNVCTKFRDNPWSSCWDILINLLVALEKKSVECFFREFNAILLNKWKLWFAGGARRKANGSSKSVEFTLWGSWISEPNVMSIHSKFVKIFKCGPGDWLTDQYCHPKSQAVPLQPGLDIPGLALCSWQGCCDQEACWQTGVHSPAGIACGIRLHIPQAVSNCQSNIVALLPLCLSSFTHSLKWTQVESQMMLNESS